MGDRKQITIIISDSRLLEHDTGGGEHPERLEVINHSLASSALTPLLDYEQPLPATREQLLFFHTEAWLFRFEESVLSGRIYLDHTDNKIGYESFDIAMLSAGPVSEIDLLERKNAENVFCLTRPPGHHAEPNMPFGFCFFNNCVIDARYWQSCGRQRVCVFDFDTHHGNGIQTWFEENADTPSRSRAGMNKRRK